MKAAITFLAVFMFSMTSAAGESSKLVDVDKSSKLSSYLKKINTKMDADSESKELVQKTESPAEDEILLKEATQKAESSTKLSPVNKMMLAIFGLLFMAAFFFATVQKFGKKKGHGSIANNIKILTQKPLGPKKSLMLVRVAGETILLGVTDHNINHLKTLSLMEDELPQFTEPKFQKQLQEKIDQTKITEEVEEVDGFAVSRLDDVKKAVTKRFSI